MDQHIRKINHCLVYGWLLIVAILSISYSLEVVKGERDFSYLLIFILITALPAGPSRSDCADSIFKEAGPLQPAL